MIERLRIVDFAVSRDVEIEPGAGINVFTGETGAGKSLVVDALGFVFGARKGREVVATGAERALVNAGIAGRQTLERSLSRGGRSVTRLDGAVTTLEEAQTLGEQLVEIHGQSEQLAILRPAVQRNLLDSFAGLQSDRDAFAARVRELRSVRQAIESLVSGERERERRLDQLRFELQEIEAANLAPGEDDELRNLQSRLANVSILREALERAIESLASPALAESVAAVNEIASRDEHASGLAELATTLESTAEELMRELRHYGESIDEDPERLAGIAERLDVIARLKRKYGETVEAVIEYGRSAAEDLAALEAGGASLEDLRANEARLLPEVARLATSLSNRRRHAAKELVERVAAELELLGMGGSRLAIGFQCSDAPNGIAVAFPDFDLVDAHWQPVATLDEVSREVTESGIDRIEFLVSFNPGQDPRPLGSVASGGETSRFMLALAIVFSESAEPRCIVLDEVDEGVGGRSGQLIGEALRRLAARHQVLCITHLPQVAAYGDRHFVVTKETDGRSTWSTVTLLDEAGRVAELAEMLGGQTEANRSAAASLLAEVRPAQTR